jgi:type II secretory pathway component PulF
MKMNLRNCLSMLTPPESVPEVSGTLIYPMIMMCVGTAIIVFLLSYVVPQVATIFAQQHADLPLATKVLIRFSAFVTSHWAPMAILSLAFVAGIVGALATPRGRSLYHYCDQTYSRRITRAIERVMTLAMAAVIVFMMLAVLMPIFQLNQLMQ